MQTVDPNEKLFLFGYSCKIFRDDEKAKYIDQGKHLIPWMGDESVMIDRYDARGHLHDLKQYEPNPSLKIEDPNAEEEKLCDEERYRSLRSDMSEEQLYQEEELKRLRAAIASDGAYHEIGFSYDNEVEKFNEPEGPKNEEPEDELYEAPTGLIVPKGMEVPFNMKIHTIIEKTALFVSEQGGQMEIIIKMKQQHNPQFGFMHLDNPLYPYYKFLVKEIKSGSYKPIQTKKVSQSEDEDDDGHYLHPSLLSGKKDNVPQFTVPSINFRRSQDDSYAVLVRNLQQQLAEEKQAREQQQKEMEAAAEQERLLNNESMNDSLNNSTTSVTSVPPPPPEIQQIIQKMAEYVAKNGEDFEYIVKSRNDKRFDFLQPTSEYYDYYIQQRNEAKHRFQPTPPPPPPPLTNTAVCSSEETVTSATPAVYSNEVTVSQNDSSTYPTATQEELIPAEQLYEEDTALYSQNSQDAMYGPQLQQQDVTMEDQSNSIDSVDSVGIPKETKSKSAKVLKGPISFSLKSKDADAVPTEKIKIPLLLDDSDEDSNGEAPKEKEETKKRRKSADESWSAPNSRHDSVEREEKAKLTSEMEAKLAEERMKDKLLSAARERLVQQKKEKRLEMERLKREEQLKKERQLQVEQQRKEKQLQLERKKKAALFLKMLKKRNPELDVEKSSDNLKSEKPGDDLWSIGDESSENGVLFPVSKMNLSSSNRIPGIKTNWSESSSSEESGEEIMITEFCSNPDAAPETTSVPAPEPETVSEPVKHEHKKKKKKHSRSRSQDRRPKSYRTRERHKSRSPKNYKHEKSKKEKQLPAAYALVRSRSRSRSRSPRRYRPNPYWNRRR